MPLPNKNENKEHFISRFVSNPEMIKKHPDEKQRLAIAYSEWSNKDTQVFSIEETKEIASKLDTNFENFSIEEFHKGLNIELEHTDVTKGDPIETGKIALAHLKEKSDYYTRLKKFVEVKDSKVIYDAGILKNKRATIMRDGYYKYLAQEVDNSHPYPFDIFTVYRPSEEIKKAYDRFRDLIRLPVIANHPENDLNLNDERAYADGEGIEPHLTIEDGQMLLHCKLHLKNKAKEFYDKGIKEISCGWHGEFEKAPEGLDYTHIQRFKDFNHIAILERGRCGNTCSIKDKGVLDMEVKDLEQLINRLVDEKLKSMKDSEPPKTEETPKNEEPPKTEEKNENTNIQKPETKEVTDGSKENAGTSHESQESLKEEEDEYETVEDTDPIGTIKEWNGAKYRKNSSGSWERVKGKQSETEKSKVKMRYEKKKEMNDNAIEDADAKMNDMRIQIRDAFVENAKGTYEAVELGIVKAVDTLGKTPCEIKAMVVKNVLDQEVDIKDMAMLNKLFDVALKNYEHPAWKNKKVSDSGLVGIDDLRNKSRKELEKIAIGEHITGGK